MVPVLKVVLTIRTVRPNCQCLVVVHQSREIQPPSFSESDVSSTYPFLSLLVIVSMLFVTAIVVAIVSTSLVVPADGFSEKTSDVSVEQKPQLLVEQNIDAAGGAKAAVLSVPDVSKNEYEERPVQPHRQLRRELAPISRASTATTENAWESTTERKSGGGHPDQPADEVRPDQPVAMAVPRESATPPDPERNHQLIAWRAPPSSAPGKKKPRHGDKTPPAGSFASMLPSWMSSVRKAKSENDF